MADAPTKPCPCGGVMEWAPADTDDSGRGGSEVAIKAGWSCASCWRVEPSDEPDDDCDASAAGLILDGVIDGETGEVTDDAFEDEFDDEDDSVPDDAEP